MSENIEFEYVRNDCDGERFCLGRGGHGTVFKARLKENGRFVAVKEIKVSASCKLQMSRMLKMEEEFKLQKACEHENVLMVENFFLMDLDMAFNQTFVAILELMDLTCCDHLLMRIGKFSEKEAFYVAKSILTALSYIHSKGIVHRDIKPGNILCNSAGLCKLSDFGSAIRLKDARKEMKTVQFDGEDRVLVTFGTGPYMSPEVKNGRKWKEEIDVFSLGVSVMELVWRDLGNCEPDIPFEIVGEMNFSNDMREFITLATEKEPKKRNSTKSLLKLNSIRNAVDSLEFSKSLNEKLQRANRLEETECKLTDLIFAGSC